MIDAKEKLKMTKGKNAEEIMKLTEVFFCPYCGAFYTDADVYSLISESCIYCNSKAELVKASHNMDYFINQNRDWEETLIEEEHIKDNPLWNDECERRKKIIRGDRIEQFSTENKNKPKCPTCQSTKIKKISALNRGASIAIFGLFSSKISKQFECENCGYKW